MLKIYFIEKKNAEICPWSRWIAKANRGVLFPHSPNRQNDCWETAPRFLPLAPSPSLSRQKSPHKQANPDHLSPVPPPPPPPLIFFFISLSIYIKFLLWLNNNKNTCVITTIEQQQQKQLRFNSMAISRSAPMEERDQLQGARRSAVGDYLEQQQQQDGVYLIHSQVMRIKKEEEEARELLLKLQLLETRPAGGGRCPATTLRASRSLSPLRRAGGAIPVGEWSIDDDLFFFLWDRRVSTWCLSMLTCCLLWCLSAWFRALAVGCSTPDVHVIPLSCLCCKISVIEFTYLAYILAKQSLDVFVRWFLIWSFSGPPLFSNSVQIVHELVQTSDCKVSLCHHSLQSTSSSIVNSHRKTKY